MDSCQTKSVATTSSFAAAASYEQNVLFSSNPFEWIERAFMKPIQPSLSCSSIKHQCNKRKDPNFQLRLLHSLLLHFFVWIEKREKHWDNDNNNNNQNNRLCIWICVEIRLGLKIRSNTGAKSFRNIAKE